MSVERGSLRSCYTQPAPASRQPPVTAPRNGGGAGAPKPGPACPARAAGTRAASSPTATISNPAAGSAMIRHGFRRASLSAAVRPPRNVTPRRIPMSKTRERTFKALGYDFKHVQIDLKSNADALEAGTIVGSATYTTAGRSLAAYWKETEIRMDIKVVNPCPDEVAKLKAAGLAVVDVDPKGAFSKDVGPAMLKAVPILFGYNARIDLPEDIAYKMIKAFYDKRDELVKIDPGFTPMAKDFVGMQVQGIDANPQIPVHPGLAKFLKEHKAWNDKWKIAGSAS